MKYLEEFNWFRKKKAEVKPKLNPISKEEIDDILLELSDMGYIVGNLGPIAPSRHTGEFVISCHGESEYSRFNWLAVKDCFLRLKNYLGDHYIEFSYKLYYTEYKETTIELTENTELDNFGKTIFGAYIYYK